MNRKEIEKAYNKLIGEIEDRRMYDGRNTVDRYTCEDCGYIIHTTYKDKGVTPFAIQCTRCGGTMYHNKTFDKKTVPGYVLIHNWYRPTLEQTLKMSNGMIEHILNGGLILDTPKEVSNEIRTEKA